MKRLLLLLAVLAFACPVHAQTVTLVAPTSAQITTLEPPAITSFRLMLYPVGVLPTSGAPVVEMEAPATGAVPGLVAGQQVYLVALAQLLTMVAPPFRTVPYILWVSAKNATTSTPAIAAPNALTVNAPIAPAPNPLVSVGLVP